MQISDGFFADSESDALTEMRKLAGCEVKLCVYPRTKKLIYYLSEHGHLFSIQQVCGRCLTRGPKKPGSNSAKGKRKDGGVTHRMSNGRHGKGGESWVAAELLLYCTFILGYWNPELKIDFKNGRADDLRPDNLMEHREDIPQEWAERLSSFGDIYQKNFSNVVRSVRWWCAISEEDAKDVAQATFIWLSTAGYKGQMNAALWTYWARKRGLDFYYHHQRHYNTDDYDAVLEMRGQRDKSVEVDLFHLQKGEKRSRYLTLWAQGHTPTEIAEMVGSTTGNVGGSVTHSIQFLRKYFRHEKKYLRP